MGNEVSNHFKYQEGIKLVDFANDVFKIRLMNNTFTFDKDTDATWADISASELTAGNGYSAGGATLAGVSVSEDDTGDQLKVTWNNQSWTASGGSIGPSNGAAIVDDTTADDTVVGFIDFGSAQTVADGGNFTIINLEFDKT